MADLMTAVWDFEKLQTQYKYFRVPTASLTVGGTDLTKAAGIAVSRVEAVLLLDGVSSVRVEFSDCYDVKNSTYLSPVKDAAVLGKTVELKLGYQSSLEKVFKGYLSNVRTRASAEDGYSMEFVALDVRKLMMTDNCHAREYKVTNYSDAVSEILKRYAKLASASVEATEENLEEGLLWQNSSDYDFIRSDLIDNGRVDREFFVAVDTAYFRKPASVTSPVITLRPGSGLVSLEADAEYENTNFTVLGFDPGNREPVSGEAISKTAGEISDALGGPGQWFVSDPSCTSASMGSAHAQALAKRSLMKSQKAQISCIGLPQLIPGRFIAIDRVDSNVNKKYYINRVTHTFDNEGFRTVVDTVGWE